MSGLEYYVKMNYKSIEEHKWKIKLLKTDNKRIFVGVAPIDFDVNSSNFNT